MNFKLSIIFLLSIAPVCSIAQNDFGAWTGLDLRIPITKKLVTGVELQTRFNSNITQVDQSFFSTYIKYDALKATQIGIDYRFSNNSIEDQFFGRSNSHRITFDTKIGILSSKKSTVITLEKTRFKLNGRVRLTNEFDGDDLTNDYLRGRLKLSYNIAKSKIEPHVAVEFFYHFNDHLTYTETAVVSSHQFNKYRIRVGVNYQIKKRQNIKLFYIVEPKIESTKVNYVLGLGYQYKFKRLNK